jgi:hypothetical protein
MTEQQPPNGGGNPDESFEWTGADTADAGLEGEASSEPPPQNAKAREWIGQLQAMIDDLAEQAAPTIRQVGVKAAELAAVAGEKAGPLAQKAAVMTESAGTKLAEKSRALADELRREDEPRPATPEPDSATDPAPAADPANPGGQP